MDPVRTVRSEDTGEDPLVLRNAKRDGPIGVTMTAWDPLNDADMGPSPIWHLVSCSEMHNSLSMYVSEPTDRREIPAQLPDKRIGVNTTGWWRSPSTIVQR